MSNHIDQVNVGVWLSRKKWNEMSNKGLFSQDEILKSDIVQPINTDNGVISPIIYNRIDVDNITPHESKYDAILHKNSEIMTSSIYFQIPECIKEYSTALHQSITYNTHKNPVIVDDFNLVEKTLDRCLTFNMLLNVFPVGEDSQYIIPDSILPVCLPHTVLLYKPPSPNDNNNNTTIDDDTTQQQQQQQEHQHQPFTIPSKSDLLLSPGPGLSVGFPPLTFAHALNTTQLAQYPFFFDTYGDGIHYNKSNEATSSSSQQPQQQPVLLCIKSVLSSGSIVSHSMVLTHNAIQYNNDTDETTQSSSSSSLSGPTDSTTTTTTTTTPSTTMYLPSPALDMLPSGLLMASHVSPHTCVYKVYVMGDRVEIEIRDSIDISPLYDNTQHDIQHDNYKELVKEATSIIEENKSKETLYTLAKMQQDKLQSSSSSSSSQSNHSTSSLSSETTTQPSPTPLYFNSQYMKMHPYHGKISTNNNNNTILSPTSSSIEIDTQNILTSLLDGTTQELLPMYPNQHYLPHSHHGITGEEIVPPYPFPTLNDLGYTDDDGHDTTTRATTATTTSKTRLSHEIRMGPRTIIPPYFPHTHTLSHIEQDSIISTTQAWKTHVKVRTLLKTLLITSKVDDTTTTTATTNNSPPSSNVNHIPHDIYASCVAAAKLIHSSFGLTLFGFDVVQHSITGTLYLIDVNYFPSYTTVPHLPAEVASCILKQVKK